MPKDKMTIQEALYHLANSTTYFDARGLDKEALTTLILYAENRNLWDQLKRSNIPDTRFLLQLKMREESQS